MKATLLLCAGILTLIPGLPAAATPALNAAQLLSQASVNPIYMDIAYTKKTVQPLQEAIFIATEAAEAARKKPGRTTFANITLERGISEAIDASTTSDADGTRVIDCEGFASVVTKTLYQNSSEMSHYAAIGWGLTEKRAASKIAALAKSPSFDGCHNAVIAISKGIIEEMTSETYDGADAALEGKKDFYKGWIELNS